MSYTNRAITEGLEVTEEFLLKVCRIHEINSVDHFVESFSKELPGLFCSLESPSSRFFFSALLAGLLRAASSSQTQSSIEAILTEAKAEARTIIFHYLKETPHAQPQGN